MLAVRAAAVVVLLGAVVTPRPLEKMPPLPAVGTLGFEILDGGTGLHMPGKLSFLGVGGTADPRFTTTDIGREEGGAVSAYNRVFSAVGFGYVRVPIGTYDVYVTRGPEWSMSLTRGLRVGNAGASLRASLEHVVPTPGWLSGDFHVHAASSPDSRVPMRHRVYEFLADGIDLIVSTDHNVVADYGPEIADLHAEQLLASTTGDEITTASWGHFGAFPLPRVLEQAGQGAVLAHGRTAETLFANVRRTAPGALINVHHPRLDGQVGYFAVAGFNGTGAQKPGFSFAFDAIEVLNGYQDPDRRSLDRVLADWYALLNHGRLVTATGNSDTHHLTYNLAGYPRNFVAMADDHPGTFTGAKLVEGLRARHSFFTTGPFIEVRAGAGGIGDIVPAPGGHLGVEVNVRAAPWIDVDRLSVIVGGKTVAVIPIAASAAVLRFSQVLDVPAARDTFVVFRVDGDRSMQPVIGDRLRFAVRPVAITNPVFLDANSDGKWDPPVTSGRPSL